MKTQFFALIGIFTLVLSSAEASQPSLKSETNSNSRMNLMAGSSNNWKAFATEVEAISINCLSGAPVNFAETMRPGSRFFLFADQMRQIGMTIQDPSFRVTMTHQGSQYTTGNAPCPLGDLLEIQLTLK